MQEGCEDFSERGHNNGCCLYCDDSHDGCLCFDCKCTKCLWYTREDGVGRCEKVEVLKEEQKQRFIENIRSREATESKGYRKLKELNQNLFLEMKKKGISPQSYSCQKCGFVFWSGEDKKIIFGKEPLCKRCEGRKNG